MPGHTYKTFSERVHHDAIVNRIPVNGSIELTTQCNLRCLHCYVRNDCSTNSELTTDDWLRILDEIAQEGCLWVLLTGGEPLVRPDFLDIYTHAKKCGLLITLFTNGTTVTPRIADHLVEWPPVAVEITLLGATAETHDQVTGVPGSFDDCRLGIELLLERGLPLRLKTMVLTLNHEELPAMQEYAESLGVEFRFDPMINAGLDGDRSPLACRLSPEEVVALDTGDAKRMKAWREFCDRSLSPPSDPDKLFQCAAGQSAFHIDASGRLSACEMYREQAYDLHTGSFRDGWRCLARVRESTWDVDTECRKCYLLELCGQCPGWGQLEAGNAGKAVDFLCKVAHGRANALDVTARGKEGPDAEAKD